MMNSLLARVMCNIGGVMQNHLVLDPFCGGGGILAEAALMGAKVVGIDRNWKLLMGAKLNLMNQDSSDFSLIQGDSRYLPIKNFDNIITDPPYGRTSSTRGSASVNLVEELIMQLDDSIGSEKRLCICGSKEMELKELFERYGLKIGNSILIPVHSGLIREVVSIIL